MPVRISQDPVEIEAGATGNLRSSQLPVEIEAGATATLRATQLPVEIVAGVPPGALRLSQMALEIVIPACQRTQIFGGPFLDFEGNVIASGRVRFQISYDCQSCDHNQVSSGLDVFITLDSSGNIPTSPVFLLWPNANLTNANKAITYLMTVFAASGQLIYQRPIVIPNNVDTYNIGNA